MNKMKILMIVNLAVSALLFVMFTSFIGYFIIYNPDKTFAIKFETSGGTGIHTQHIGRKGLVTEPALPVKENYVFEGWYADAGFTKPFDFSTKINEPAKLFAKWQRIELAVVYDYNDGSNQTFIDDGILKGEETALKDGSLFSRVGYTLAGWNSKPDGTGEAYQFGEAITPDETFTLYAIWQAGNRTKQYYANDGTASVYTVNTSYDASVTISYTGFNYNRPNYHIIGWNTAADGNGTFFSNGQAHVMKSDLELFAVWSADARAVIYNAGYGVGLDIIMGTFYNAAVTIQNNTTFVKPNYSLKGWNTVPDGSGTMFEIGQPHTVTSNLVLYAIWQADAKTITYKPNGTTENDVVVETEFDEVLILKDSATFVLDNYYISHWNTEADGSGESFNLEQLHIVKDNLILYAIWAPEARTITYNANGGIGIDITLDTYFGAKGLTAAANTFTRQGYEFMGWSFDSGDGNIEGILPLESLGTIANNIVLCAVWRLE